jgi:hypothetical protein
VRTSSLPPAHPLSHAMSYLRARRGSQKSWTGLGPRPASPLRRTAATALRPSALIAKDVHCRQPDKCSAAARICHYHPLLSVIIHYYPLLSIVIHYRYHVIIHGFIDGMFSKSWPDFGVSVSLPSWIAMRRGLIHLQNSAEASPAIQRKALARPAATDPTCISCVYCL